MYISGVEVQLKDQVNQEIQTYISYLDEVLGISKVYNMENLENSVLSQSQESAIADSKSDSNDLNFENQLSVYIENLNLFNHQEKELLEKMLSALKLKKNEYQLKDLNYYFQTDILMNQNFNKPHLFLLLDLEIHKKNILEKNQINNQINTQINRSEDIFTWSPQVLIKKPELKRQAWNELQLLIRRLQKDII